MLTRVRVRGIYATAITRLLLEGGFHIVQASDQIAERFSLPQLTLPADVTVKSGSDPSELLVVGYTDHADRVLELLTRSIKYSFVWASSLPLHATVKARVEGKRNGRCVAKVGSILAILSTSEGLCESGKLVVASVVRPGVKPDELPRLVPGARVIGDYAILYESDKPSVTVSEHVRSKEKRAELQAIASDITSRGYGVHWRSSSRFAHPDQLIIHLRELEQELQKVKAEAEAGGEGVYSRGERVAVLHLSGVDKAVLDEVRNGVVPTVRHHHSLKSLSTDLSVVVDFAERLLKEFEREVVSRELLAFVADRVSELGRVKVLHVKPDGSVISLGVSEVKTVQVNESSLKIILERKVKSHGLYDGLDVAREPGDTIVTEVESSKWYIVHRYYAPSGRLKGIYVNVNTPPEVTPGTVKYLDLEVDVVARPGEEPRIIDEDKLRRWVDMGVISDELARKAVEVARSVAERLE
jgi:Ribonuclease G/E